MKISKISLFCAVLCNCANAQTNKTENIANSLLWEVTGNGLQQPSYIFGTYHMLCEKDYKIKPSVRKAFDKSLKLITEVNMMDSTQLATMARLNIPNNNFIAELDSVKLSEFKTSLREWDMSFDDIKGYNKVMLASMTAIKSLGCPISSIKSFEMDFLAFAKSHKMPVIGLESMEEQFAFVNNSSSAVDIIKPFLNIQATKSQYLLMVKIYKEENLNQLYQLMSDSAYMSATTKKIMLDNRNENWIKKLPSLLKEGTCFIAIGAGHLPGHNGVISLLQKQGYLLTPITGD